MKQQADINCISKIFCCNQVLFYLLNKAGEVAALSLRPSDDGFSKNHMQVVHHLKTSHLQL
jgi:hypothetical protein